MRRGEIRWAHLPAPIGRRPVLLLSRNAAYRVRLNVTVAPLSRTVRGIPREVFLTPADGVPVECAVNLDDIMTIPKALLGRRIAILSAEKLKLVRDAILYSLALEE